MAARPKSISAWRRHKSKYACNEASTAIACMLKDAKIAIKQQERKIAGQVTGTLPFGSHNDIAIKRAYLHKANSQAVELVDSGYIKSEN